MNNPYQLIKAKLIKSVTENVDTTTLFIEMPNQKDFQFLAGQFMQIGLPGWGECPISISSNPNDAKKYFTLTIRAVGELTRKLTSLKKGETVYVRGPFGNGFPEVGNRNLILIGGGCGFIPLRSAFEENKNRQDIKIQTFIGCRDSDALVFKKELKDMKAKMDLNIILEKMVDPEFSKKKGLVTDLIAAKNLLPNSIVLVCGPDIMFKFVVKALLAKKINPADIYLSLEKRMHCGVGVCQHCAIGSKYICNDGPVFSYEFLSTIDKYKY